MGSPNSKRKGKVGELELSHELCRLFGVECRRGVQYEGGSDSPDVVGIPGVHVECKRTEALRLWDAINQAVDESGENIPAVFHRANNRPWLVIARLDDMPELVTKLFQVLAAKQS